MTEVREVRQSRRLKSVQALQAIMHPKKALPPPIPPIPSLNTSNLALEVMAKREYLSHFRTSWLHPQLVTIINHIISKNNPRFGREYFLKSNAGLVIEMSRLCVPLEVSTNLLFQILTEMTRGNYDAQVLLNPLSTLIEMTRLWYYDRQKKWKEIELLPEEESKRRKLQLKPSEIGPFLSYDDIQYLPEGELNIHSLEYASLSEMSSTGTSPKCPCMACLERRYHEVETFTLSSSVRGEVMDFASAPPSVGPVVKSALPPARRVTHPEKLPELRKQMKEMEAEVKSLELLSNELRLFAAEDAAMASTDMAILLRVLDEFTFDSSKSSISLTSLRLENIDALPVSILKLSEQESLRWRDYVSSRRSIPSKNLEMEKLILKKLKFVALASLSDSGAIVDRSTGTSSSASVDPPILVDEAVKSKKSNGKFPANSNQRTKSIVQSQSENAEMTSLIRIDDSVVENWSNACLTNTSVDASEAAVWEDPHAWLGTFSPVSLQWHKLSSTALSCSGLSNIVPSTSNRQRGGNLHKTVLSIEKEICPTRISADVVISGLKDTLKALIASDEIHSKEAHSEASHSYKVDDELPHLEASSHKTETGYNKTNDSMPKYRLPEELGVCLSMMQAVEAVLSPNSALFINEDSACDEDLETRKNALRLFDHCVKIICYSVLGSARRCLTELVQLEPLVSRVIPFLRKNSQGSKDTLETDDASNKGMQGLLDSVLQLTVETLVPRSLRTAVLQKYVNFRDSGILEMNRVSLHEGPVRISAAGILRNADRAVRVLQHSEMIPSTDSVHILYDSHLQQKLKNFAVLSKACQLANADSEDQRNNELTMKEEDISMNPHSKPPPLSNEEKREMQKVYKAELCSLVDFICNKNYIVAKKAMFVHEAVLRLTMDFLNPPSTLISASVRRNYMRIVAQAKQMSAPLKEVSTDSTTTPNSIIPYIPASLRGAPNFLYTLRSAPLNISETVLRKSRKELCTLPNVCKIALLSLPQSRLKTIVSQFNYPSVYRKEGSSLLDLGDWSDEDCAVLLSTLGVRLSLATVAALVESPQRAELPYEPYSLHHPLLNRSACITEELLMPASIQFSRSVTTKNDISSTQNSNLSKALPPNNDSTAVVASATPSQRICKNPLLSSLHENVPSTPLLRLQKAFMRAVYVTPLPSITGAQLSPLGISSRSRGALALAAVRARRRERRLLQVLERQLGPHALAPIVTAAVPHSAPNAPPSALSTVLSLWRGTKAQLERAKKLLGPQKKGVASNHSTVHQPASVLTGRAMRSSALVSQLFTSSSSLSSKSKDINNNAVTRNQMVVVGGEGNLVSSNQYVDMLEQRLRALANRAGALARRQSILLRVTMKDKPASIRGRIVIRTTSNYLSGPISLTPETEEDPVDTSKNNGNILDKHYTIRGYGRIGGINPALRNAHALDGYSQYFETIYASPPEMKIPIPGVHMKEKNSYDIEKQRNKLICSLDSLTFDTMIRSTTAPKHTNRWIEDITFKPLTSQHFGNATSKFDDISLSDSNTRSTEVFGLETFAMVLQERYEGSMTRSPEWLRRMRLAVRRLCLAATRSLVEFEENKEPVRTPRPVTTKLGCLSLGMEDLYTYTFPSSNAGSSIRKKHSKAEKRKAPAGKRGSAIINSLQTLTQLRFNSSRAGGVGISYGEKFPLGSLVARGPVFKFSYEINSQKGKNKKKSRAKSKSQAKNANTTMKKNSSSSRENAKVVKGKLIPEKQRSSSSNIPVKTSTSTEKENVSLSSVPEKRKKKIPSGSLQKRRTMRRSLMERSERLRLLSMLRRKMTPENRKLWKERRKWKKRNITLLRALRRSWLASPHLSLGSAFSNPSMFVSNETGFVKLNYKLGKSIPRSTEKLKKTKSESSSNRTKVTTKRVHTSNVNISANLKKNIVKPAAQTIASNGASKSSVSSDAKSKLKSQSKSESITTTSEKLKMLKRMKLRKQKEMKKRIRKVKSRAFLRPPSLSRRLSIANILKSLSKQQRKLEGSKKCRVTLQKKHQDLSNVEYSDLNARIAAVVQNLQLASRPSTASAIRRHLLQFQVPTTNLRMLLKRKKTLRSRILRKTGIWSRIDPKSGALVSKALFKRVPPTYFTSPSSQPRQKSLNSVRVSELGKMIGAIAASTSHSKLLTPVPPHLIADVMGLLGESNRRTQEMKRMYGFLHDVNRVVDLYHHFPVPKSEDNSDSTLPDTTTADSSLDTKQSNEEMNLDDEFTVESRELYFVSSADFADSNTNEPLLSETVSTMQLSVQKEKLMAVQQFLKFLRFSVPPPLFNVSPALEKLQSALVHEDDSEVVLAAQSMYQERDFALPSSNLFLNDFILQLFNRKKHSSISNIPSSTDWGFRVPVQTNKDHDGKFYENNMLDTKMECEFDLKYQTITPFTRTETVIRPGMSITAFAMMCVAHNANCEPLEGADGLRRLASKNPSTVEFTPSSISLEISTTNRQSSRLARLLDVKFGPPPEALVQDTRRSRRQEFTDSEDSETDTESEDEEQLYSKTVVAKKPPPKGKAPSRSKAAAKSESEFEKDESSESDSDSYADEDESDSEEGSVHEDSDGDLAVFAGLPSKKDSKIWEEINKERRAKRKGLAWIPDWAIALGLKPADNPEAAIKAQKSKKSAPIQQKSKAKTSSSGKTSMNMDKNSTTKSALKTKPVKPRLPRLILTLGGGSRAVETEKVPSQKSSKKQKIENMKDKKSRSKYNLKARYTPFKIKDRTLQKTIRKLSFIEQRRRKHPVPELTYTRSLLERINGELLNGDVPDYCRGMLGAGDIVDLARGKLRREITKKFQKRLLKLQRMKNNKLKMKEGEIDSAPSMKNAQNSTATSTAFDSAGAVMSSDAVPVDSSVMSMEMDESVRAEDYKLSHLPISFFNTYSVEPSLLVSSGLLPCLFGLPTMRDLLPYPHDAINAAMRKEKTVLKKSRTIVKRVNAQLKRNLAKAIRDLRLNGDPVFHKNVPSVSANVEEMKPSISSDSPEDEGKNASLTTSASAVCSTDTKVPGIEDSEPKVDVIENPTLTQTVKEVSHDRTKPNMQKESAKKALRDALAVRKQQSKTLAQALARRLSTESKQSLLDLISSRGITVSQLLTVQRASMKKSWSRLISKHKHVLSRQIRYKKYKRLLLKMMKWRMKLTQRKSAGKSIRPSLHKAKSLVSPALGTENDVVKSIDAITGELLVCKRASSNVVSDTSKRRKLSNGVAADTSAPKSQPLNGKKKMPGKAKKYLSKKSLLKRKLLRRRFWKMIMKKKKIIRKIRLTPRVIRKIYARKKLYERRRAMLIKFWGYYKSEPLDSELKKKLKLKLNSMLEWLKRVKPSIKAIRKGLHLAKLHRLYEAAMKKRSGTKKAKNALQKLQSSKNNSCSKCRSKMIKCIHRQTKQSQDRSQVALGLKEKRNKGLKTKLTKLGSKPQLKSSKKSSVSVPTTLKSKMTSSRTSNSACKIPKGIKPDQMTPRQRKAWSQREKGRLQARIDAEAPRREAAAKRKATAAAKKKPGKLQAGKRLNGRAPQFLKYPIPCPHGVQRRVPTAPIKNSGNVVRYKDTYYVTANGTVRRSRKSQLFAGRFFEGHSMRKRPHYQLMRNLILEAGRRVGVNVTPFSKEKRQAKLDLELWENTIRSRYRSQHPSGEVISLVNKTYRRPTLQEAKEIRVREREKLKEYYRLKRERMVNGVVDYTSNGMPNGRPFPKFNPFVHSKDVFNPDNEEVLVRKGPKLPMPWKIGRIAMGLGSIYTCTSIVSRLKIHRVKNRRLLVKPYISKVTGEPHLVYKDLMNLGKIIRFIRLVREKNKERLKQCFTTIKYWKPKSINLETRRIVRKNNEEIIFYRKTGKRLFKLTKRRTVSKKKFRRNVGIVRRLICKYALGDKFKKPVLKPVQSIPFSFKKDPLTSVSPFYASRLLRTK